MFCTVTVHSPWLSTDSKNAAPCCSLCSTLSGSTLASWWTPTPLNHRETSETPSIPTLLTHTHMELLFHHLFPSLFSILPSFSRPLLFFFLTSYSLFLSYLFLWLSSPLPPCQVEIHGARWDSYSQSHHVSRSLHCLSSTGGAERSVLWSHSPVSYYSYYSYIYRQAAKVFTYSPIWEMCWITWSSVRCRWKSVTFLRVLHTEALCFPLIQCHPSCDYADPCTKILSN